MNTIASAPIAIFALTPPQILLKTDPITHPVAHVGLSIVNHYKDPLGVLVVFGPWLGQAMLETVKLYVNGNPNPITSEIVMDASAPVLLRLPTDLLLEGVNSLHCTVERLSGNNETSPQLRVLYDIYAPGGDDPVPGGGHPALTISASPTSVDAAQAEVGVTLTLDYSNKHLYDLVTVDCGGVLLTHRIEPTPTDPDPDLTKPIVITLTTAHFANDPNNPQFAIKYNVVSQTGNFSGTTQFGKFNAQDHWSVPFLIDVHLERIKLEMTILQEQLGENGDDPTLVDLDKMKGGPLWALIHLIQTIWQKNDQIHLTFTAELNGTVVGSYDVTLLIEQVPGEFSVEIANKKVVAGSRLSVKYDQIRDGKVIGVSAVAEAQVVGKGLPKLEMDTTPVSLSGARYYVALPAAAPGYELPSHPAVGSYIDRPATGGVGAVSYSSSNVDVASVGQNGRAFARANGVATITATDSENQTKSYSVTTSGDAKRVFGEINHRNWNDTAQYLRAVGGRLFSKDELVPIYLSFTPAYLQIEGQTQGTRTSTPGQSGTHLVFYWTGRTPEVSDTTDCLFFYVKL